MWWCSVTWYRCGQRMSCLTHDICGICGRNCYSAFCRGRLHTSHMHCTGNQLNISGGPCGGQYAVAWGYGIGPSYVAPSLLWTTMFWSANHLGINCCKVVSFPYFLHIVLWQWQSLWVWLHVERCMLWQWGTLLARWFVALCCLNSAAVLWRVNNVC